MRTWLVIPALGATAAAIAAAFGAPVTHAFAAGCAGAAIAGAVRALMGESPAALAGAVIAPLLAMAAIAESGGSFGAPCAALAGIAWTVVELARGEAKLDAKGWTPPPLVAALPAAIATVASPAAAPLLAIVGIGALRAQRAAAPAAVPHAATAVLGAGAVAIVLALAAGASRGSFAELWFGSAAHPIAPAALASRAASSLGPLAAIAALGGLAWIARALIAAATRRRRAAAASHGLASLAVAACAAGALLVDLRMGAVSPVTLGLAALLAGLAIGRFAGQIRMPAGQAFAAAAIGAMLLVPPAWTAVDRTSASRTARTSR